MDVDNDDKKRKRRKKKTTKLRYVWDKEKLMSLGVGVVHPDMHVNVDDIMRYLRQFMIYRYTVKHNEAKTKKSYVNNFRTTFSKLFDSYETKVMLKHVVYAFMHQNNPTNQTADRLLVSWYYFCCKYKNEDFTTSKTVFNCHQLEFVGTGNFEELLETNEELKSWVVKKEGHLAFFMPKSIRKCNPRRDKLQKDDRLQFADTITFGSVLTKEYLLQILQSYDSFTFSKRDVRLEHNLTNMGEHIHVEADLPKEVNLSNDVKKQIYNLVKQASNSTVQ